MSASKRFFHDVKTELKPWTNENFGGSADSDDFNFIIFGDRAGRPLAGVTEEAIAKINLLNPDFVMSVGDFIPGCCYEAYSPEFIQRQWDAFEKILKPCEPPFFRVVGNHDIPSKGSEGGVLAHTHDMQTELWQKQFGATYYSFVFKDVLFICLHTMEIRGGSAAGASGQCSQKPWPSAEASGHYDPVSAGDEHHRHTKL
jgi:hypothetical protein